MWIDPTTQDVAITHSDIRMLRPNWSGPSAVTDQMIADLGFVEVVQVSPEYDPKMQSVTELAPHLVDDVWTQQWQVNDLTPEEIQALYEASVPQTVSRRQGRQALLLGGYLDKVQPIIDSLSDPLQKGMTQIWWEDADSFDRNNPTVLTLGTALGLTSADLDNLFIQAAQL